MNIVGSKHEYLNPRQEDFIYGRAPTNAPFSEKFPSLLILDREGLSAIPSLPAGTRLSAMMWSLIPYNHNNDSRNEKMALTHI